MGIRVGVAGTGRLGREHVRILSGMAGVDAVFCFDHDAERCRSVSSEFGARACASLDELLDHSNALSIVASTRAHASIARPAIERGLDLFIEKPLAASVADAEDIVDLAARAGALLQVGHVERFNPALQHVAPQIQNPEFIEVHRLAPFTPRGADVSVVGDLMIHDLDLIARFVGEWPLDIRARGASVLTPSPDIVNVRLEFPGGCVANVTASRVTMKPMRKMRVFCNREYFSIDLLAGSAQRYRPVDDFDARLELLRGKDNSTPPAGESSGAVSLADFIKIESWRGDGEEPLRRELEAFAESVRTRQSPVVSGEEGLRAVRLAAAVVDNLAGKKR